MTFQIEIVQVKVDKQGTYRIANVQHKLSDGKVDNKKVVSFIYKDVFKVLSEAQPGDLFEIDSQKIKNEKDGKEYWTWVSAVSLGKNGSVQGAQPSTGVARVASRSTYETPEERAARQVYIVRQSSVSSAIELAKTNQDEQPFTTKDIIEVAKEFEAYVFGNEPVVLDVKPAEVS